MTVVSGQPRRLRETIMAMAPVQYRKTAGYKGLAKIGCRLKKKRFFQLFLPTAAGHPLYQSHSPITCYGDQADCTIGMLFEF
jgi:hypothetical protein